jgi:histidinol-phosphatase (PHP family)
VSLVSYHGGHSGEYCCHAQDTKELLLKEYVSQGFESFALIEHLPPPDDLFLYPDEKEAGFSATSLQSRIDHLFFEKAPFLKQQFADVDFFVGFETEFYGPDPLGWLEDRFNRYTPDIVVASVHHVDSIPFDYSEDLYLTALTTSGGIEALYRNYFRQQRELFRWLRNTVRCPVIVGHFDLIKIFAKPQTGLWEVDDIEVTENIKIAVDAGFLFEINPRAYAKGLAEPYPSLELVQQIVNLGGKITFGDDSHSVAGVGSEYLTLAQELKNKLQSYTVLKRGRGGEVEEQERPFSDFIRAVEESSHY